MPVMDELWKELETYEKFGKTIVWNHDRCHFVWNGFIRGRQGLPGGRGKPCRR